MGLREDGVGMSGGCEGVRSRSRWASRRWGRKGLVLVFEGWAKVLVRGEARMQWLQISFEGGSAGGGDCGCRALRV